MRRQLMPDKDGFICAAFHQRHGHAAVRTGRIVDGVGQAMRLELRHQTRAGRFRLVVGNEPLFDLQNLSDQQSPSYL